MAWKCLTRFLVQFLPLFCLIQHRHCFFNKILTQFDDNKFDPKDLLFNLGKSVIEKMLHHPAKSVIEVLERPMGNYLTRELSNSAHQMIADTSSALFHNIHAKKIRGLSDCFIRKSHYTNIGFVDAKNKTKSSLPSHGVQRFGTSLMTLRGRLSMPSWKDENNQKTEDKNYKTEHAVLKLLTNNGYSKNPLFSSLDKLQKVFLDDIFAGRPLTDKLLYHKWSMSDEKEELTFIGRIQRTKRKKTNSSSATGRQKKLLEIANYFNKCLPYATLGFLGARDRTKNTLE
ncbi:hypothetical protein HELRODRAFT_161033 [Helobdella robusta]|uniref:Uncharacterized protein n=1 Tax=Helobdella robusta TaxID=6412 RepID=T1ER12_HELRO|nr:hypothetical protein HELRODRAFT_161033 [Helobdella robusta]ESO01854.1 hypothetical protein HELRODRAFT_161033 [Helobdella robusta]